MSEESSREAMPTTFELADKIEFANREYNESAGEHTETSMETVLAELQRQRSVTSSLSHAISELEEEILKLKRGL